MALAHAVREITEMLDEAGIEVQIDPDLPEGSSVIEETVFPTVTWHGQVISPGQIIVRQAPAKPRDSVEGIA
jgi:hypothetical protein